MSAPARKVKTKLHFNRVNMARKDPRVWSAHNSRSCNMAKKIKVVHDGKVIMETVFNPKGKQPRAYFVAHASVSFKGGTAIVRV